MELFLSTKSANNGEKNENYNSSGFIESINCINIQGKHLELLNVMNREHPNRYSNIELFHKSYWGVMRTVFISYFFI
jgi:hypothetical protein